MEHVDSIVLSTLAKLKCTFCEDGVPEGLEDLSRDDVIEGIVKLLWVIDPDIKTVIPSFKLPGSAAQKFQVATCIANTVNEFGFKRDPVGYHTLLYANVFELRRIFITLIERLPQEKVWVEKSSTKFEHILEDIGEKIQEDSVKQWVPEFCRYFNYKYDGKYWHRPEDLERINFCTSQTLLNVDARFNFCRALNEPNLNKNLIPSENYSSVFSNVAQKAHVIPRPTLPPKPVVAKPLPPSRTVKIQSSSLLHSAEEKEQIASNIALVKAEILSQQHEIMELCYAHSRLEDDIGYYNELLAATDPKLFQLLIDPNKSLEMLQDDLAQLHKNDINTQETFLKGKEELSKQLEHLRILKGFSIQNDAEKNHISKIQDLIVIRRKKLTEDVRHVEKLKKKLSMELNVSDRQVFLSRIMKIMQTINALLEKRKKMFQESNILDREILHLDGNLKRTYSVVDTWMMPAAYRDGQLQRAYRNLITLHERCLAIRRLIEDCGTLSKEIDEVTNELEIETQNATNIRLDALLSDVAQIQDENAVLQKQKEAMLDLTKATT